MKFFRRFILVPSVVAVILLEVFYFIGLALWLIGWPVSDRIDDSNNYNGLWDDNAPARFYYILVAVLIIINMIMLPLTLIPFWKGYISRWSTALTFPLALWILAVLTNVLYATVRFIPLNCGNTAQLMSEQDYNNADYCRGSKIIFSGTLVLMFTAGICAGYLTWLLQEVLFQGTRKVHKRAKGRDAKIATVERGTVVRETVSAY